MNESDWLNGIEFDQSNLYEGNSIFRGKKPKNLKTHYFSLLILKCISNHLYNLNKPTNTITAISDVIAGIAISGYVTFSGYSTINIICDNINKLLVWLWNYI